MGWLQPLIVTTVTAIIVGAIMESARRKSRADGPDIFTVRQPGAVVAVGIVCMVVFAAFLLLSSYAAKVQGSLSGDELLFTFGAFSFFFLLGAFVTLYAARFEIRGEYSRIIYTPVVGRARVVRREDIAYLVPGSKIKVYDAHHRRLFVVDGPCKNRAALESWMHRHSVPFFRKESAMQVLRYRLQTIGMRPEREYLPKGDRQAAKRRQEANKLWQERQRRYMESPPDLPENLEELMLPSRRKSIGLIADNPAIHCVIGRSKFGGEPDLPSGFRWDYYEGEAPVFEADSSYQMVRQSRPLAFLLQINCAEVAAVWPESPLPKQGLLSFFYELTTMLWGPERLDRAGYVKVHYFPSTGGFVRTPTPEGVPPEHRIIQHPITLNSQYSLPDFQSFREQTGCTNNFANLKLYDQTRAGMGVAYSGHGELGMDSRLFGWPASIQNDVFDEFSEMFQKDLESRPIPEFERERMVSPHPEEDWELLLQLDSGTFDEMGAGGVMFGDYGNLYFGIRKDDLGGKSFDRTWFTLQCT